MSPNPRSSWWLVTAGLVAMLVGAIDPLEGSPGIVAGIAVAGCGAWLGERRGLRLLVWGLVLAAAGVAIMFGLSAIGGFGGQTGRSIWWGVLLLPYPIGWLLGLVGAGLALRRPSRQAG